MSVVPDSSGGYVACEMPEMPDVLRIDELNMQFRIVDRAEDVTSNMQLPRDFVRRNIRNFFNEYGIKVYVFHDRIEIRGHIPTQVIDATHPIGPPKCWSIIGSERGLRG